MIAALDHGRTTSVLDGLVAFAHDPPGTPQADDPADVLLRPRLRSKWRRLEAAVASLTDEPADADLHQVRILAKRCRYALEASAPVFGARSTELAKSVARLQDVLGDLNDVAVICMRLQHAAASSPAQAFAAGQIAGQLLAGAEAFRRNWRPAWDNVRRHRFTRWL